MDWIGLDVVVGSTARMVRDRDRDQVVTCQGEVILHLRVSMFSTILHLFSAASRIRMVLRYDGMLPFFCFRRSTAAIGTFDLSNQMGRPQLNSCR